MGLSNSEPLVKNLYDNALQFHVIFNLRLKTCSPMLFMLFLILNVCIVPRCFVPQHDKQKTKLEDIALQAFLFKPY